LNGVNLVPLQEYGVEDPVTQEIDKSIKFYLGLRQFTAASCCFIGAIEETGTPVPKMIDWTTIISEVEHRNMQYNNHVSLKDFIN
jgi:hypothetical protein